MIKANDYINNFSVGQVDEIYRGEIAGELLTRALKGSANMMVTSKPGITGRPGFRKLAPATLTGNDEDTRVESVRIEAGSADYLVLFSSGDMYLYENDGTFVDSVATGMSTSVWAYQYAIIRNYMIIVDGINEPAVIDMSTPGTLSAAAFATYLWKQPRFSPYDFSQAGYSYIWAGKYTGTVSGIATFYDCTDPGGLWYDFFTDCQTVGEDGSFYMGLYNTTRAGEFFGKVTNITSDQVQAEEITTSGSFTVTDVVICTVHCPWSDITATSWETGAGMSFSSFAPAAVELHEGRLIFSNDKGGTEADDNFWISGAGRPIDFVATLLDDTPLMLDPVERYGPINWLKSHNKLFFGTEEGVWEFGQSGGLSIYTIRSPLAKSTYGTAGIKPLPFGNSLVFSMINKKGLQSTNYSYETEDYETFYLSRMRVDQFSGVTIRQIIALPEPVNCFFVVTSDNNAWVVLYDAKNQINLWVKFYDGGDLISLAATKVSEGVNLFGFFRRSVDGSDVDRLEYINFQKEYDATYAAARKLDSWIEWTGSSKAITGVSQASEAVITITDGGATFANGDIIEISAVVGMTELNGNQYMLSDESGDTFKLKDSGGVAYVDSSGYTAYSSGGIADEVLQTITSLSAYEGETITVVTDSSIDIGLTVSGNETTLTHWAKSYYLGFAYTMYIQPFIAKPHFGNLKAVINVLVNVFKSYGFKTGPTVASAIDVNENTMVDSITASELFTRYVEASVESDKDYDPDLFIVQDKPYPFTPLSILVEAE